jgi:hypothetical protein
MAPVEQFKTDSEFWSKMVVPDCQEYCEKPADFRSALHVAISLFHTADWVFHTHERAAKHPSDMNSPAVAQPDSGVSPTTAATVGTFLGLGLGLRDNRIIHPRSGGIQDTPKWTAPQD